MYITDLIAEWVASAARGAYDFARNCFRSAGRFLADNTEYLLIGSLSILALSGVTGIALSPGFITAVEVGTVLAMLRSIALVVRDGSLVASLMSGLAHWVRTDRDELRNDERRNHLQLTAEQREEITQLAQAANEARQSHSAAETRNLEHQRQHITDQRRIEAEERRRRNAEQQLVEQIRAEQPAAANAQSNAAATSQVVSAVAAQWRQRNPTVGNVAAGTQPSNDDNQPRAAVRRRAR